MDRVLIRRSHAIRLHSPRTPIPSPAPPSADPDIELMLQVQAGDRASFACLVNKHRDAVEQFLYGKVRNRAVAEELTQEVFLRVYRSRATYQPLARFKTWLFQIASHLGSNSRRDRRKEMLHEHLDHRTPNRPAFQIADYRPSVEQVLLRAVRLQEVRSAVAALPEKQRTAVMMHKFGEKEYSEIAVVLGCSESAVKSLMFRAHEALRERLAHMVKA